MITHLPNEPLAVENSATIAKALKYTWLGESLFEKPFGMSFETNFNETLMSNGWTLLELFNQIEILKAF